MFLLDRFFDGTFFTYGIEVMSFADRDQEDRIDPMIYVFPRFYNIVNTSVTYFSVKCLGDNYIEFAVTISYAHAHAPG